MLRALRIEYPSAIYHVMNRGDRREPIYQDDADRTRFLQPWVKPGARPIGKFTPAV